MLVCSVRRSPLPQNPRIFQRDRNAGAARYQARRIVRWWTRCGYCRGVNVAALGAGQLANTPHLLQSRLSASGAVGVELYAHRTRIDFAEVQLDFKYMPVARGLTFSTPKCIGSQFWSSERCQSVIAAPILPLAAAR